MKIQQDKINISGLLALASLAFSGPQPVAASEVSSTSEVPVVASQPKIDIDALVDSFNNSATVALFRYREEPRARWSDIQYGTPIKGLGNLHAEMPVIIDHERQLLPTGEGLKTGDLFYALLDESGTIREHWKAGVSQLADRLAEIQIDAKGKNYFQTRIPSINSRVTISAHAEADTTYDLLTFSQDDTANTTRQWSVKTLPGLHSIDHVALVHNEVPSLEFHFFPLKHVIKFSRVAQNLIIDDAVVDIYPGYSSMLPAGRYKLETYYNTDAGIRLYQCATPYEGNLLADEKRSLNWTRLQQIFDPVDGHLLSTLEFKRQPASEPEQSRLGREYIYTMRSYEFNHDGRITKTADFHESTQNALAPISMKKIDSVKRKLD